MGWGMCLVERRFTSYFARYSLCSPLSFSSLLPAAFSILLLLNDSGPPESARGQRDSYLFLYCIFFSVFLLLLLHAPSSFVFGIPVLRVTGNFRSLLCSPKRKRRRCRRRCRCKPAAVLLSAPFLLLQFFVLGDMHWPPNGHRTTSWPWLFSSSFFPFFSSSFFFFLFFFFSYT